MGALVVFESMYGNTWRVAEAVADGLSLELSVEVVEVGSAPRRIDGSVGLLVVGAPTHALGLSQPATRASAAEQAGRAVISGGEGVREWLDALEVTGGLWVATFDTHIDKRWVPGSAARRVKRLLKASGCRPLAKPTSFYVEGTEGPLQPGELDRARAWGERLAREVANVGA